MLLGIVLVGVRAVVGQVAGGVVSEAGIGDLVVGRIEAVLRAEALRLLVLRASSCCRNGRKRTPDCRSNCRWRRHWSGGANPYWTTRLGPAEGGGVGGAIRPSPWRRKTVRCAAFRQISWHPSPWQFCT